VKASNTSNTGKKGSNFLVIKKDMDDSSSEDGDEAVSIFSDDDGPQMFDCNDEKEDSNDDASDDDNDVSDEVNEERDDGKDDIDDKKDDTNDDDYDEHTDTDEDYEGFAFLQNEVMC